MDSGVSFLVWTLVSASAGGLVLARVIALRRRPELWWIAYTSTFVGIAIGCALMSNEDGINRRLGVPNLAHLLADLCIVAAGCSIVIYMGFLVWRKPRTSFIRANVLVAVVVASIMVVGWTLAPIHDTYYPISREIPITGGLVAYEMTFHLYVIAFLAFNLAGLIVADPSVAPADPAAKLNRVVGASILVIGAGQIIHLVKVIPRLRSDSVFLGNLGDLVTLIGIVGVSVCNTVIFLGPRMSLARRSRRLLRELDPLHARLLRAYPQIHVSSVEIYPWRVSLRAERTIIEIGDALCLLPVDPAVANRCPFAAVSEALDARARRMAPTDTVSAMSVLPVPGARAEEERLLIKLSRRVRADAS